MNKYYGEDKRNSSYFTEDLSQWYGAHDFDSDNSGYMESIRYQLNKQAKAGTRRQFSLNMLYNGLNADYAPLLPMLEFVVHCERNEKGENYPNEARYHGGEIVLSGIVSVSQLDYMLTNMGKTDNGTEYPNAFAFIANGRHISIRIIQLRRGKRLESMYLADNGRIEVEPIRLKEFSREMKTRKKRATK